ncbi:MAG TPA: hypothetical protein VMT47_04485 [Polyangia bacterium]|jgi:hypothetical protein|nr:hypothetical protein [Polyangia bacterium]
MTRNSDKNGRPVNGSASTDLGERMFAPLRTGMEALGSALESATRQTAERPLRTLSLALGAGYALGGGVFSRLTVRLIGMATRLALRASSASLIAWAVVSVVKSVPVKSPIEVSRSS